MESHQVTDLFGDIDQEMLYQSALRQPLARKIEQAVALIRTYEGQALRLSPEGYYVAFSGGKDSIVLERLFHMAGVKYQAWYNNVTIDPPELVQFIKRQYPHVPWNSVGISLPMYMGKFPKGPPTRMGRWCCEIYKEQGGNGLFKAVGVRAEESKRRKGLWTPLKKDTRSNMLILAPLVYWTTADIWQFIRDNGMAYCGLYDEGFERLGCVGCPLAGPVQQRKEFDRWPKYEQLWQRGFKAHFDAWHNVPRKRDGEDRWIAQFKDWQSLWEWWISGKAYEGEQADCQLWLW